jgi:hypothetical protein
MSLVISIDSRHSITLATALAAVIASLLALPMNSQETVNVFVMINLQEKKKLKPRPPKQIGRAHV